MSEYENQNTHLAPINVFLTETQLAERHQRSIKTLQNLRVTGEGIPFIKIGRSVRYRLCDLLEWEQKNLRSSTSDIGDSAR